MKAPRRVRAACALTLAALAAVPAASVPPATHSLVIQSSEALQLAPKDDNEWYEKACGRLSEPD